VVNWFTAFVVLTTIAALVLSYLQLRKSRWKKYSCRRLPYDRIFRGKEYGYDPLSFLTNVRSAEMVFKELETWYRADDKPILLKGVTGVGKSRLVTEFLGRLSLWQRIWRTVMVPTSDDLRKSPPIFAAGCILFLNDLHEFRDVVADSRLISLVGQKQFKVIATIPTERYDPSWNVLSNFVWKEISVEKWTPDNGRRLAEARKTQFDSESFTGTPLSIISPAAEIKQSYELLSGESKAVLQALKIVKTHLGCYADYRLCSSIPGLISKFDESAFTDTISKQNIWCKTNGGWAILADGVEDFIRYDVTIEDAYKLEIVLEHEENHFKNSELFLYNLGNRFHMLNDNWRAFKCYNKSSEINPDIALVWNNRGAVLEELGRAEDALHSYQRAVVSDPDFTEGWINQSSALEVLGRKLEALTCLNVALEIDSKDALAWNKRGLLLYALGRREEALKSLEKALEINPNDDGPWVNRVAILRDLGRKEEALRSIEKALEINPNSGTAWMNQGVVLGELGRNDEAYKSFHRAVTVEPKNAKAWYDLGVFQWNSDRLEDALSSYEQALAINPEFLDALINKTLILRRLDRNEEALRSIGKALEIDPRNRTIWVAKGQTLTALGRNHDALRSFDMAIELDANDADCWNDRGVILGELGRNSDALSSFDKAIDLGLRASATWYKRGEVLHKLGRIEEALGSFDNATKQDPKHAESWCYRGGILLLLDRKTESIECSEKALSINPSFGIAWFNKGVALHELGRSDEALVCVQNGLKYRDSLEDKGKVGYLNWVEILFALGVEAVCGGNMDKARQLAESFKSVYGEFRDDSFRVQLDDSVNKVESSSNGVKKAAFATFRRMCYESRLM